MGDVELVIKLSRGIYEGIAGDDFDRSREVVRSFQATIADAIKNSTLLPKGHGRLIDADALLKENPQFDIYPFPSTTIDYASTIIPADKGVKK